jgi:hypothetical protein
LTTLSVLREVCSLLCSSSFYGFVLWHLHQ